MPSALRSFRRPPRLGATAVGVGLSVAAGILLLGVAFGVGSGRLVEVLGVPVRPAHAYDVAALAFLAGAGFPSLARWLERRRRLEMEARLPDFLAEVASLHKAGLTLADSLVAASAGAYGALSAEVQVAAHQLRWNVPVLKVLASLRDRVGTPIAQRSLTVVIEAARTGGNVPEVLELAARHAQSFVGMREQRRSAMGMYTIITYVASAVFIGVVLALQGIFVPRLTEAFGETGGAALGFAVLPTPDAFRGLFYLAAIAMAVGNGLIGGIMSDGRALDGAKHAWGMVAMAFVGFALAG